jgi:hypothetical protein
MMRQIATSRASTQASLTNDQISNHAKTHVLLSTSSKLKNWRIGKAVFSRLIQRSETDVVERFERSIERSKKATTPERATIFIDRVVQRTAHKPECLDVVV